MSFPMFSDNECTVVNDNVFIHNFLESHYRVWFKQGHSYFPIGVEYPNLEDAQSYARMFAGALDRYRATAGRV